MKDPRAEMLRSSLIVEDGDIIVEGAAGKVTLTVRHPATEEKAAVEMTQRQTGMLAAMLTESMAADGDEDF